MIPIDTEGMQVNQVKTATFNAWRAAAARRLEASNDLTRASLKWQVSKGCTAAQAEALLAEIDSLRDALCKARAIESQAWESVEAERDEVAA
jgi:hypothetical protein